MMSNRSWFLQLKPIPATVTEVRKEADDVCTLCFDAPMLDRAMPGQYVMVWVHRLDEVPMALSSYNAITIQNVGEATRVLTGMKPGDIIGLRGPYGSGFGIKGSDILIIAGGVGAAPLAPLAEACASRGIKVTALLGAKTVSDLIFVERFKAVGELMTATDDGTEGYLGPVTELMKDVNLEEYDQLYACGPELMMRGVLDMCAERGIESTLQMSLHRYVKCGVGLCGACCIDPDGLRVCCEGPVFTGDKLVGSELGKYRRDASGRKTYPWGRE